MNQLKPSIQHGVEIFQDQLLDLFTQSKKIKMKPNQILYFEQVISNDFKIISLSEISLCSEDTFECVIGDDKDAQKQLFLEGHSFLGLGIKETEKFDPITFYPFTKIIHRKYVQNKEIQLGINYRGMYCCFIII